MLSKIQVKNFDAMHSLFADMDANVNLLEKRLLVKIKSSGTEIIIEGPDHNVKRAIAAINMLMDDYQNIDFQRIDYVVELLDSGELPVGFNEYEKPNDSSDKGAGSGNHEKIKNFSKNTIISTYKGKPIRPKTLGQSRYVEAIEKHDVVFGIGPAGTGKTFLAVAIAIRELKAGNVAKIIITRPAVEAGENLGFLPGDLQMKVDPYLRPIYDAMQDILGLETFGTLRERGIIEIAPLAYMRGRTLDHAFVILDEAQNTTKEQMKMFLTRFGEHSRVVVNGDISQIDLPHGQRSGLKNAERVLRGISEIAFTSFSEKDVVRHRLVKKIIARYSEFEDKQQKNKIQKAAKPNKKND